MHRIPVDAGHCFRRYQSIDDRFLRCLCCRQKERAHCIIREPSVYAWP